MAHSCNPCGESLLQLCAYKTAGGQVLLARVAGSGTASGDAARQRARGPMQQELSDRQAEVMQARPALEDEQDELESICQDEWQRRRGAQQQLAPEQEQEPEPEPQSVGEMLAAMWFKGSF